MDKRRLCYRMLGVTNGVKDIINIGKIPIEQRFNYKKTLQKLLDCADEKELTKFKSAHELVVRKIELKMKLSEKIPNYKADEWKYMIDDDYNFWMMKIDYIERNFIIKEGK